MRAPRRGRVSLLASVAALVVVACQTSQPQRADDPEIQRPSTRLIPPSAEALPSAETVDGSYDSVVLSSGAGDAAWIVAADRQFGLRIYALDGQEVAAFGVGRLNQVDAVRIADDEYVVAASNQTTLAVDLFRASIDEGVLTVTPTVPMPLALAEPHGLCTELVDDTLRIYVGDRSGRLEEWRVDEDGFGSLAGAITFPTRTEACVVDGGARRMYVGEGGVGIWSVDLDTGDRTLIDGVANHHLLADADGLDIYDAAGERYLVASSAVSHLFAVYRLPSAEPLVAFRVGPNPGLGIDGLVATAGIAVSSASLPGYPAGILVAHEGPHDTRNFKLLDWRAIEVLLPQ